jgi:MSHA biogenesis protein MshO
VSARGFTLVELIAVIVLTSILSAMVASFIPIPMLGYAATAQRAALSDAADGALRRIARELRGALPNSVRVSADGKSIEFLAVRSGGRYRIEQDCSAACSGDILDFSAADTSFDVLGPAVELAVGDQIVIYNLGIPGADAYAGNTSNQHNRRAYSGSAGTQTNISVSSTQAWPLDSPGRRFQVVSAAVTFQCNGSELRRYSGYPIASSPNLAAATSDGLLTDHVSDCSFVYDNDALAQRVGLVSMRLQLTTHGESVLLFHAIHVNNVP